MGSTARVVVEVLAGLVPEQPLEEFTRRFGLTSTEWEQAARPDTRRSQAEVLAELNGQAAGYAHLLMIQPDRVNWVRLDWIWL